MLGRGFFFEFTITSSPAVVLQRSVLGFLRLQNTLRKNLKKHLIVVNCNELSRTHPCPVPPSSESQDLKNEVEFSIQVALNVAFHFFSVLVPCRAAGSAQL